MTFAHNQKKDGNPIFPEEPWQLLPKAGWGIIIHNKQPSVPVGVQTPAPAGSVLRGAPSLLALSSQGRRNSFARLHEEEEELRGDLCLYRWPVGAGSEGPQSQWSVATSRGGVRRERGGDIPVPEARAC